MSTINAMLASSMFPMPVLAPKSSQRTFCFIKFLCPIVWRIFSVTHTHNFLLILRFLLVPLFLWRTISERLDNILRAFQTFLSGSRTAGPGICVRWRAQQNGSLLLCMCVRYGRIIGIYLVSVIVQPCQAFVSVVAAVAAGLCGCVRRVQGHRSGCVFFASQAERVEQIPPHFLHKRIEF